METVTAALSANAGISLTAGGKRVWADAVHSTPTPPYSTLSPELFEKMLTHRAFAAPDLLFFSHCHPDHYSEEMAKRAKALWPGAVIAAPEPAEGCDIALRGSRVRILRDGVELEFARLPHEGEQYAAVSHYVLLASVGEVTALFTGDCAVADPGLGDFLDGRKVDLAFFDFPWLTLPKGRRYIEERVRPAHLLICHLPFGAEDRFGYRRAAERAAASVSGIDVKLMSEPLQTETLCVRP